MKATPASRSTYDTDKEETCRNLPCKQTRDQRSTQPDNSQCNITHSTMRFPALSILLIAALASAAKAETLNTVFTQTRDCFDCPMGVAGDLSIKVCGNRGCCFSFRLDNGENNFQRGDYDEFTGLGVLGECDNFDVSEICN